jgi:hypothetical protein
VLIALAPIQGEKKMSKFANSDFQAGLLKEIEKAAVRKRKLEEDIKSVDAVNKVLIDKAAQRDIEAFRNRHHRPPTAS